MKKLTFTILMGVLVSSVINVFPAYGADVKNYPGAMCVRRGGAVNANVDLSFGGIQNPSATQELRVECPVIHDEIGAGTSRAWVRAVDQNFTSGQNVKCRFASAYRIGTVWLWDVTPVRETIGGSNLIQQIGFSKDLSSNVISHYYFGCRIPPMQQGRKSMITAYSVTEK